MEFFMNENQPKNRGQLVYGCDAEAEGVFPDGRRWKGLVICKLINCREDVIKFLNKVYPIEHNEDGKGSFVSLECWNKNYDKLYLEDEYSAMAKCSVEDTFDPEIGMKLARERVLYKYRMDKAQALSEFETDMMVRLAAVGKELDFVIDKINEE